MWSPRRFETEASFLRWRRGIFPRNILDRSFLRGFVCESAIALINGPPFRRPEFEAQSPCALSSESSRGGLARVSRDREKVLGICHESAARLARSGIRSIHRRF